MTMFTETRPATLIRPIRLTGIFRALGHALSVQQQRQRLKTLDDLALDDIGISYRAAICEARRPIWDVPGYWRR